MGLALGVITAIGAVFLFLIYFGGATIDGPQDGSVLDALGGVGAWLEAIGILLVLPVLPFIALAGVIAGSLGYTRSDERGQRRTAVAGFYLSLVGAVPYLAMLIVAKTS